MKRILLSTIAVVLLGVVATQFVRLQECEATTTRDVVEYPYEAAASAVFTDSPPVNEMLAQSEPTSFGTFEAPAAVVSNAGSKRTIKVPVTKTVYEDVTVEMGDVTPLQQRYSVLMLKRAQRMTEEELNAAIAEVEAELQAQDEAADGELNKAIEILEKLEQDAGGTPAATRAGQALPILQGKAPARGKATIFPSSYNSQPQSVIPGPAR